MSEAAESEFWEFVARERAALEQVKKPTLEDVVAWLEAERRKSEERRFSYSIRDEQVRAAYEEGWLDAINEVLRRLREVRA